MKKEKKGAKISARCHTKDVVKLISNSLKGETLEEFNKSCFGPLLNLAYGEVNFQLQLLYHAMINLKDSNDNSGVPVPVFKFNNTTMEFNKREFYLMTGLKFGVIEELPVKSDLHSKVLKGRQHIKFSDVKKEFTSACILNKGKGDTCFQLALLVFLYGVLLPRDNTVKTLDMKYIHLADDVKRFNDYPWGFVAYDYLCRSLLNAYSLMVPQMNKKPTTQPAFDVCGFLFALQCWFYEIMPDIGKEMGEHVLNWSVTFPRVLRWKSIGVHRYEKVKKLLDDPELVVQPLKISLTEKISLQHIAVYLNNKKIESISSDRKEELSRPKSVKRKISYPNGEDTCSKAVKREYKLRSKVKCGVAIENEEEVPSADANMKGGNETGESITTPCDCDKGKLLHALEKAVFLLNEKIESSTARTESNVLEIMAFIRKYVQPAAGPDIPPVTALRTNIETPGGRTKSTPGPGAVEEANNSPGVQKVSVAEKQEYKSPKSLSSGDHMDKTDYDGDDSASFDVEGFAENVLVDCPIQVATEEFISTPPSTAIEWNSVLFEKPRSHDPIPRAPLRTRPNTRSNPVIVTSSSNASGSLLGTCAANLVSNNEARMEEVAEAEDAAAGGDGVRTMYDPLKRCTPGLFQDFEEWYHFARRTGSSISLRVTWPETAGYHFFYPMFMKYQKLSTLQTDAILFLLLIKQKQKPAAFLSNWTVMEQQCWVKFQRGITTQNVKNVLLRFVRGELPEQGGKPWVEVDHVYGVAHVLKDHFVAYDVQVADQRIVVYDSMSMCGSRADMLSEFDHMSSLIPELIGDAGVKRHSGPLKARWPVVLHRHPPQQHNGHDCGIYALKFIECLATGRSVDYITRNIGPSARNTYCSEFYHSMNEA